MRAPSEHIKTLQRRVDFLKSREHQNSFDLSEMGSLEWAIVNLQPQRTWVGLDWLPECKCGLHLSHNEHRDVYETIEEFYDADDFISPEEWNKAVAADNVWVLHWYPNTPIGFIRIAASTLDALEAKVKEIDHG
jgi:hypothetical protein